jgi:putative transposase
MNYVLKVKIHPNNSLIKRIEELFNVSRFTYNWLNAASISLKKTKVSLHDIHELQKEFRMKVRTASLTDKFGNPYLSDFLILLKNAPSQISDFECKNLAKGWKTLKKSSHPKFKKKFKDKNSFTIHCKTISSIIFNNDYLKVVGINFPIKLPNNIRFLDSSKKIKSVTFTKSNYGYYMSILIDIDDNTFLKEDTNKFIGIDWGVTNFITDSEGNKVTMKSLKLTKLNNRVKLLQSKLGKKRNKNSSWKTSKRYMKLKTKISYTFEKISNIKQNFIIHQANSYLSKYDIVVIEDLKPRNMIKNHKLARSISESMFYTWKVILQYKAEMYGKYVVLVNPKNTSQTCSNCGEVKDKLNKLKLSNKIFKCDHCGLELDRDHNAAINILNLG